MPPVGAVHFVQEAPHASIVSPLHAGIPEVPEVPDVPELPEVPEVPEVPDDMPPLDVAFGSVEKSPRSEVHAKRPRPAVSTIANVREVRRDMFVRFYTSAEVSTNERRTWVRVGKREEHRRAGLEWFVTIQPQAKSETSSPGCSAIRPPGWSSPF